MCVLLSGGNTWTENERIWRKTSGYSLAYKLEKHTGDWDKPYSCQIYIFVSSYYCYFRLDMFVWECSLAAF